MKKGMSIRCFLFLLTPLREGRQLHFLHPPHGCTDFYSRPCGRGDRTLGLHGAPPEYFYSRPCGRGDLFDVDVRIVLLDISTHAPAGGATITVEYITAN